MNQFLQFFFTVSIIALDAFCTNPSHLGLWSPPPPETVDPSECFVVREIAGGSFPDVPFSYHLICPQKLPDDGSQQSRNAKNWYLVRTFTDLPFNTAPYDCRRIEQSLIKFVFLDDMTVKFVIGPTVPTYRITFLSLEQSQAFYGIIYRDVNLLKAASINITVLHELVIHSSEHRKIGENVQALYEIIEDILYITLKNEGGEPLFVFCKAEAAIMRIKRSQDDKRQLLFRLHSKYYILTFNNWTEAKQFSYALLKHVTSIYMSRVHRDVLDSFEYNQIAADAPQFYHFL